MKFPIFTSRLICATTLLALNACNFTDMAKSPSQTVVAATVNGATISESRVDLLVKQASPQGQPATDEVRKEIIEHLSMQYLIAQEALKKGLEKAPEVSDQIDLARQSILANAFVQDYFKNNPVSDDALKTEYEVIKNKMAGNEYKAKHILVESETDAKSIISTLKKNPNAFGSMAKQKSKDPGSKSNGGDLGWFDPRGMVPEFGAAVEKLTKGTITETPVKSKFGYHVILLEDTRPKIIPPLEQVKPALQQQIQQQNLKKLFDELKAKAKIEIHKKTAAPAKESATSESKN